MKKYNNTYIIILLLTIIFSSCSKEKFTDMNTNEELLVSTDPKFVFTNATNNWNNGSRGDLMGKYSGVMQLMQYVVSNSGGQEGIYSNPIMDRGPSPSLPYYNYFYNGYGNKLSYLINFVIPNRTDKLRYQNISAISSILYNYQAWLTFDTHGAAPYTEAMLGLQGNNTPKYDLLQDLYKVFDKNIKDQIAILQSQLTDQVELGNNDFFYNGDVVKWTKFANTLRIKIAQRFEKVDTDHYNSVVNEVLSHPAGIISNNDESCIYFHNIEHNNDTWDTAILTSQYSAGNAFVSFLYDNNDPRLAILVRRNGFGSGNNNPDNNALADTLVKYFPDYNTNPLYSRYTKRYVGMPASPSLASEESSRDFISFNTTVGTRDVNFTIRATSQVQSRFFVKNGGNAETASGNRNIDYPRFNDNEMKLFSPQITYAETCFMMAEIAEKSGGSKGGKTAEAWYKDGIRASMLQYQTWGERMKVLSAASAEANDYAPITQAKIETYLAQPQIQYTGSTHHKLELIISQAWVNYFMRPEEAWATWKRTGLPKFKNYEAPNPTDGTAFLDHVSNATNEEILIPRRSILPTPNVANLNNFNEALEKLKENPNYLEPNKTHGRIFWDKL